MTTMEVTPNRRLLLPWSVEESDAGRYEANHPGF